MPVILYDNPISGNCYKVRLLFGLLGLEVERREVSVLDLSARPQVLGGLSPSLNVPAVVLEDGRPLAESGAILWHFGEGTRYLPEDPYERAQVLQWMFFEQYNVGPGIAIVRYFASIAEEPPPAEQIEARRPTGRAALKTMERHLREREFFVGERLTIADIALFAYVHVAPEGGFDLAPHPAVCRWLERVAAQPGFVPMAA